MTWPVVGTQCLPPSALICQLFLFSSACPGPLEDLAQLYGNLIASICWNHAYFPVSPGPVLIWWPRVTAWSCLLIKFYLTPCASRLSFLSNPEISAIKTWESTCQLFTDNQKGWLLSLPNSEYRWAVWSNSCRPGSSPGLLALLGSVSTTEVSIGMCSLPAHC